MIPRSSSNQRRGRPGEARLRVGVPVEAARGDDDRDRRLDLAGATRLGTVVRSTGVAVTTTVVPGAPIGIIVADNTAPGDSALDEARLERVVEVPRELLR